MERSRAVKGEESNDRELKSHLHSIKRCISGRQCMCKRRRRRKDEGRQRGGGGGVRLTCVEGSSVAEETTLVTSVTKLNRKRSYPVHRGFACVVAIQRRKYEVSVLRASSRQ